MEKFNWYKKMDEKIKEIVVPDQVFFGLIFFNINGPLKFFPTIKAIVSFKKDIRIIK